MADEQKPAAPPAHTPPKPPAEMAATPWEGELPGRLRERFGERVQACQSYAGQNFVVVEPGAVIEILEYLKVEEDFEYLVDVTAVHYPKRERPFELFYILYAFPPRNERMRVKTTLAEGEEATTVTGLYAGADWMEREVYDMFGIRFAGHPNMTRILLPEDWQGYPLRKEYGIIQQDTRWVQENLQIESGQ